MLVDDEDYLKQLIRYIHLNPVRAKLAANPLQYSWSSHRAYLEENEYCWLAKERILEKFCSEKKHALKNYEQYILQGIGFETEFNFDSGSILGMLGDKEFVDEVLIMIGKKPSPNIELTHLVTKICEISNLSQEQLCMPGKHVKHANARALLAFFVREIIHLSLANLAKFLKRDASGLTALANLIENNRYNVIVLS